MADRSIAEPAASGATLPAEAAPTPSGVHAVDNDVLIKAACYRLGETLWPPGSIGTLAVLGAARYVAPKWVARANLRGNRGDALADLGRILAASSQIEPTEEEVALAAEAEAVASRLRLQLDAGEGQLAAVTAVRGYELLESGDKRGIAALERLLDEVPQLAGVCGRVACLEQVVRRSIAHATALAAVRSSVCAEPEVDKALSSCFACSSPSDPARADVDAGLRSYIDDLRRRAQRVLTA